MDRIAEHQAHIRSLLESSVLTGSTADDASRLIVNGAYLPWVRNWHVTPAGFRRVARLLAEHLQADDSEFDYLVGVLVFLYRHAIELQTKALRRLARIELGRATSEPGDHDHSLSRLWTPVEQLLEDCLIPDAWLAGGVQPGTIRSRIEEIDRLDPRSVAFRYPDGSAGLSDHEVIGVAHLSDVLDAVFDWLDGIGTGLQERRNAST